MVDKYAPNSIKAKSSVHTTHSHIRTHKEIRRVMRFISNTLHIRQAFIFKPAANIGFSV